MKAITVRMEGGVPRLIWSDVDEPSLNEDQVIIRTACTAVNRADLSQARGQYPPPAGESDILGLEVAGTIERVGAQVQGFKVGDRVCALLAGGGYGDKVAVHHKLLMPIPDLRSFQWAAAIPEVWYTAFLNLFLVGRLQRGETVLIHAGASGVGTAAVQLARDAGAQVIVTAGDETKVERCLELGADKGINYKERNFLEVLGSEQVDLILDPVGGSYLEANIDVLKPDGRLVLIGLLGGTTGKLDLRKLLTRRINILGSTLRSKTLQQKIEITVEFKRRVWPLLVEGSVNPVIDQVFPLEQAQEAHEYVRLNKSVGKVLLANASS